MRHNKLFVPDAGASALFTVAAVAMRYNSALYGGYSKRKNYQEGIIVDASALIFVVTLAALIIGYYAGPTWALLIVALVIYGTIITKGK